MARLLEMAVDSVLAPMSSMWLELKSTVSGTRIFPWPKPARRLLRCRFCCCSVRWTRHGTQTMAAASATAPVVCQLFVNLIVCIIVHFPEAESQHRGPLRAHAVAVKVDVVQRWALYNGQRQRCNAQQADPVCASRRCSNATRTSRTPAASATMHCRLGSGS